MYSDAQPTSVSLGQKRRRLLIISAISWGVWCAFLILNSWNDSLVHWKLIDPHAGLNALPSVGNFACSAVYLSAWVVWVVSLIQIRSFEKQLKKQPCLLASLTDELYQQTQLRAFARAFWAVMIGAAVIIGVSVWLPVPGNAAALIEIFVGVETFVWSFLLLDKE